MKNLRKLLAPLSIILLSVLVFTSCKKDEVVEAPKNVVGVALADPQFSTLVAALTKANLVTTLQGIGPFTVFAPNNAAFSNAGITSLDNQSAAALTPILTSHVLSGTVKGESLKFGANFPRKQLKTF